MRREVPPHPFGVRRPAAAFLPGRNRACREERRARPSRGAVLRAAESIATQRGKRWRATAAAAQYPAPVSPVPAAPSVPGSIPLVGIGAAAPLSATGFRLTFSAPYQAGAVWLVNKPSLAGGFQTTFQFQISDIGGITEESPFGLQQGAD